MGWENEGVQLGHRGPGPIWVYMVLVLPVVQDVDAADDMLLAFAQLQCRSC